MSYHLEGRIGGGGFGAVYRARDGAGRAVAVKRIHAGLSDGDRACASREALIASRLDHPNTLAVTDWYWDAEGRLCLVSDLVAGLDLAAVLTRAVLPIPAAIYVARAVLAALAHAHDAGIVHRDIKPANILIGWNGEVKLADFGVARPLRGPRTAQLRGTVQYLPPEQLDGRAGDADDGPRADLFSAGIVLYESITGQRPLVRQLLQGVLPPPSALRAEVPVGVDRVAAQLLSASPADRPRSAEDARVSLPAGDRDALVAVLAQLRAGADAEQPTEPHGLATVTSRGPRRSPRRAIAWPRWLGPAILLATALAVGWRWAPAALAPIAPVAADLVGVDLAAVPELDAGVDLAAVPGLDVDVDLAAVPGLDVTRRARIEISEYTPRGPAHVWRRQESQ